jgi:putative transposase
MAMSKMLIGISTRRYPVGLEPVGNAVERAATSTSKSAISRRFVAAIETALAELLARPLHDLDLVALMIDGVHFGDHLCVLALAIGIEGSKHPLALVEGHPWAAPLPDGFALGLGVPVAETVEGSKTGPRVVVRQPVRGAQ